MWIKYLKDFINYFRLTFTKYKFGLWLYLNLFMKLEHRAEQLELYLLNHNIGTDVTLLTKWKFEQGLLDNEYNYFAIYRPDKMTQNDGQLLIWPKQTKITTERLLKFITEVKPYLISKRYNEEFLPFLWSTKLKDHYTPIFETTCGLK